MVGGAEFCSVVYMRLLMIVILGLVRYMKSWWAVLGAVVSCEVRCRVIEDICVGIRHTPI